jgi:transcriptional regulator with XRE-family HTH domain
MAVRTEPSAGRQFGARLRRHRIAARLTQEQLAAKAGLSVRSISELERARVRFPRLESVRQLGQALALTDAAMKEFQALARDEYWADRETDRETPLPTEEADPPRAGLPFVPVVPVVPAQLPSDVATFAGRSRQLAQLDSVLGDVLIDDDARSGESTSTNIAAVSGTAGVGKTALAVHWAHQVADRFPDGQLYVNLRGFDPSGQVMQPVTALRGFLATLGVPAEQIPAGPDAQAALYRSLLAGRQMLVVLDNARDADHARPLLPGTSSALAIVTSRDPLTPLVAADGARPLTLDLLSRDEARELLGRRIAPDRIAAEPEAVDAIITACARLPLALALVAARAATHPTFSLAELGRLETSDVLAQVQAAFSWSYTALTPPAARMFRYLGLLADPEISAVAAASLTAAHVADARRSLSELTRTGLLVEHAPSHYRLHDLLAAYAGHLALAADPEDKRRIALIRLLDHYAHPVRA